MLAARLGCSPRDVLLRATCPVCHGPHGRVEVAAAAGSTHLSVTRSGPFVAIAVADVGPVGIDVESHDTLEPDSRVPALVRAWVRKEAVGKALGSGLRVDRSASAVPAASRSPSSTSTSAPRSRGSTASGPSSSACTTEPPPRHGLERARQPGPSAAPVPARAPPPRTARSARWRGRATSGAARRRSRWWGPARTFLATRLPCASTRYGLSTVTVVRYVAWSAGSSLLAGDHDGAPTGWLATITPSSGSSHPTGPQGLGIGVGLPP